MSEPAPTTPAATAEPITDPTKEPAPTPTDSSQTQVGPTPIGITPVLDDLTDILVPNPISPPVLFDPLPVPVLPPVDQSPTAPPVSPTPASVEPTPVADPIATPTPISIDTTPAPSPAPTPAPTPTPVPGPTPTPDPTPVPDPGESIAVEVDEFESVIYDGSQTGHYPPELPGNDSAEAIVAGLAQPVAAPTSTNLKMDQVADKMLGVYGSKEAANAELKRRGLTVGNKAIYNDIDQLKSANIKDKLRFIEMGQTTVNKNPQIMAYFMWGQDISLPNYNGTVIQTFEFETKAWATGQNNPVVTNEVQ